LQKKKILETNLFKLLEGKEKLKNDQFDFFIKMYLEKVNFCLQISKWLNNNLVMYRLEMNEEVKSAFQFQHDFFQQHSKHLNKYFSSSEKLTTQAPIDVAQFIEKNFKELKESLSNQSDNGKVIIDNEAQNILKGEQKREVKAQMKKPIIITEQEADKFILKRVFKVCT
jgi:hypothetical protein